MGVHRALQGFVLVKKISYLGTGEDSSRAGPGGIGMHVVEQVHCIYRERRMHSDGGHVWAYGTWTYQASRDGVLFACRGEPRHLGGPPRRVALVPPATCLPPSLLPMPPRGSQSCFQMLPQHSLLLHLPCVLSSSLHDPRASFPTT